MPNFQMTASHEWQRVGSVLITFTVTGWIDDSVFDAYLKALADPEVRLVLSVAEGSNSLTATQRRSAADLLKTRKMPAIVVTDDRVTRGILTAISWLGANVSGYSWTSLKDAIERTGESPENQQQLYDLAMAFRERPK